MWAYRELVWNLTLADLKNRYQNTALGFLWTILSPLLLTLVLFFVFHSINGADQNFAMNLIVGLMAWRFFSVGTSVALMSIVSRPSLVTKVYVPRNILVLSSVLSALVGSLAEFLIMVPILAILLRGLPVTILLFPAFHLVYVFMVYGAGLLLAGFFVYFRDLSEIWLAATNILFFCSPIVYAIATVPPELKPFYDLNPITQFIVIYRNVMVAGTLPSLQSVGIAAGFSALLFLVGSFAFERLQRRFAEEM